jgi:hypothetical protein
MFISINNNIIDYYYYYYYYISSRTIYDTVLTNKI